VGSLVERILAVNGAVVYALVALLVFAEDALFVGFVIPGETAAVLGGVDASRGHTQLWIILVVVLAAAVLGDTVGYQIGRRLGARILRWRRLDRFRDRLDRAQDLLVRRGGVAVFLGRFVAFFRAVMPFLAGASGMPYRRFLAYNAAGGVCWGTSFVLLGYLAGDSYKAFEHAAGRAAALAVLAVVLLAVAAWRIHRHRAERSARLRRTGTDRGGDQSADGQR
jgi:membrane-associated protein